MEFLKRDRLVVDFAKYTPLVNPQELIDGGVEMAIIKVDEVFPQNARLCADKGLPICGYHWEDVTEDSRKQVDRTLERIQGFPVLGIMADLEQWWSNWGEWRQAIYKNIAWSAVSVASPEKISRHAANTFAMFESEISTFGYSSKNFMDSYVYPYYKDWVNDYSWVMAHYRTQVDGGTDMGWDEFKASWLPAYEPYRPSILDADGIDNIVGHQFTGDRVGLPGMYGNLDGTKRARADVNVFNGEWLDELIGDVPPVHEDDADGEEDKGEGNMEKYYSGNVIEPYGVRFRSGPGAEYPYAEPKLIWGKEIIADDEYYDSETENVWLRIISVSGVPRLGWAAAHYSGRQLIEYVEIEGDKDVLPEENETEGDEVAIVDELKELNGKIERIVVAMESGYIPPTENPSEDPVPVSEYPKKKHIYPNDNGIAKMLRVPDWGTDDNAYMVNPMSGTPIFEYMPPQTVYEDDGGTTIWRTEADLINLLKNWACVKLDQIVINVGGTAKYLHEYPMKDENKTPFGAYGFISREYVR